MSELYVYEEDDPVLEIETEINLNKKEKDTSGVEPHTTVTKLEHKVLECLPQPKPQIQKSNVPIAHQKVTHGDM